jgi:hypothetical protein
MKAALFGLCLTAASWAAAAPDTCTADVHATERTDDERDESVGKVFAVQIDTRESCAVVDVDFTATERLSDGEEIKVRRRGSRKVKPGTGTSYKVTYRVAPGSTLLDTEFKVARCVPCAE